MFKKSMLLATVLTLCAPLSAMASTTVATATPVVVPPTSAIHVLPAPIPVSTIIQGVITTQIGGPVIANPPVYLNTVAGQQILIAPQSVTKDLLAQEGKVLNVTGYTYTVYVSNGTAVYAIAAPSFIVQHYAVVAGSETLTGKIVVGPSVVYMPVAATAGKVVVAPPISQSVYIQTSTGALVLLTGNTSGLAAANGRPISITGVASSILVTPVAKLGQQLNVFTYNFLDMAYPMAFTKVLS